jgi:hypothetical protein
MNLGGLKTDRTKELSTQVQGLIYPFRTIEENYTTLGAQLVIYPIRKTIDPVGIRWVRLIRIVSESIRFTFGLIFYGLDTSDGTCL